MTTLATPKVRVGTPPPERAPSLHLEWSPERVLAFDAAAGHRQSAGDIAELAALTAGHKEALVGVSRGRVFLKTVPLPKAAPEDLRRILSVQVGQLFPLPADQVAFDFLQTDEQTPDGWITLVAAVRAEDLRRIRDDLGRAGLRASRILPVALGAAAVARKTSDGALTDAVVLDATPNPSMGNGYTLDVVRAGLVRASRTVPFGADLATEAFRTLAAAGMPETTPLVAARAVPGDDIPAGARTSAAGTLDLLHEAPGGFGFALAEDRAREAQKRIAARTRLSILMLLSSLLLVALVWADRSDAQKNVTRGEGTWARETSKQRSIRDTAMREASQATERQNTLKAAFGTAQPPSDIAAAIGDALPSGAWITGLSIERGKPVQIRGTAVVPEDIPRFLNALSRSPRFRDVKLVVANSGRIEETNVVQFSMTATAVGNLPMPLPPKKTGAAARSRTSGSTSASGTSGGSGTTGAGT